MKKINRNKVVTGVSLGNREGVFQHGFRCYACGLHFNVYSWIYKRDSVTCPECGNSNSFFHAVKILSTSKEFGADDEIFRHSALGMPYMGNISAQLSAQETMLKMIEEAIRNQKESLSINSSEQ